MFRIQLLRTTRAASFAIKSRTQLASLSTFSNTRIASVPSIASRQSLSRRFQSTEAEKKPETETTEVSETDTLKAELEKKNKEVADYKDRYLRSVADYRNLQDRTTRESSNARLFAIQKFATDLLDSIDNLDRALSAVPKEALAPPSGEPNPDLKSLHGGLRMSEEIMMQTLKKHGIERFDPLEREGNKFDPNLDEATFFTKVEGKNDGEVFYTQSKGYTLNGRVIRASKVGVVKNA